VIVKRDTLISLYSNDPREPFASVYNVTF